MLNIDDIYKYIYHNPHDDELRVKNFSEKDTTVSYMNNKSISVNECGITSKYTVLINEPNYMEVIRNK